MNSASHASGRNPTIANTPRPVRGAQRRVERPSFRSMLRHKNDVHSTPESQSTSQSDANDPLGIFSRLPYDLRHQIWSNLTTHTSPSSRTNFSRFKRPDVWAENPGLFEGIQDLLALSLLSTAMRDDVSPILKRQMDSKTFNISFSVSRGVQFESIRCGKQLHDLDPAFKFRGKSSVFQNDALSAFARALPFIRYLNLTIELEYNDLLYGHPQRTLGLYIQQTCSLLSNVKTATLEMLKMNVRLHIDTITTTTSSTGRPEDILRNTRSSYRDAGHEPSQWRYSKAQEVVLFMVRAIAPLRKVAQTQNFPLDSQFVTRFDGMCPVRSFSQTPVYMTETYHACVMLECVYIDALKI